MEALDYLRLALAVGLLGLLMYAAYRISHQRSMNALEWWGFFCVAVSWGAIIYMTWRVTHHSDQVASVDGGWERSPAAPSHSVSLFTKEAYEKRLG